MPAIEKIPAIPWKEFQTRRPTKSELIEIFRKHPEATGVCAVLGQVSNGWVVRDFDKADSYFRWAEQYPELSKTLPTVKTSRGFHVYFLTSNYCRFKKYTDGELHGDERIIILPPSRHPSGCLYVWEKRITKSQNKPFTSEETGLAMDWSEEQTIFTPQTTSTTSTPSTPSTTSISSEEIKAVQDVVIRFLPLTIHQNHDKLFSLARHVLGLKNSFIWDANKYREMADLAFGIWHSKNKYLDPKQSKLDYQIQWDEALESVRFPPGVDVVSIAWNQSIKSARLPSIEILSRPVYKQAAYLCLELQKLNQPSHFFLSGLSLAKCLGLSEMTAWRILNRLKNKGLLKLVCKGNHFKANRYRWIGEGVTAP